MCVLVCPVERENETRDGERERQKRKARPDQAAHDNPELLKPTNVGPYS